MLHCTRSVGLESAAILSAKKVRVSPWSTSVQMLRSRFGLLSFAGWLCSLLSPERRSQQGCFAGAQQRRQSPHQRYESFLLFACVYRLSSTDIPDVSLGGSTSNAHAQRVFELVRTEPELRKVITAFARSSSAK